MPGRATAVQKEGEPHMSSYRQNQTGEGLNLVLSWSLLTMSSGSPELGEFSPACRPHPLSLAVREV